MKKNIDIEALRALAIAFVIIEHASIFLNDNALYRWIDIHLFRFWGGVDIFFAVSGFVIMTSLKNLSATGQEEKASYIVGFWLRRFFRLLPAAWLWLAIPLALTVGLGGSYAGNLYGSVSDTLASVLNIQNFHEYYCNTRGASCGIFGYYWSLSLEEQFYIALPVSMVFLSKNRLRLAMLALIAAQFFLPRNANTSDLSWFARTDAMAWGVLIALWAGEKTYAQCEPVFLRNTCLRFLFVGFCLLTVASIGLEAGVSIYVGIVALASAALVFAASHNQGYITRSTAGKTIAAYVGSRSYALYLSNVPAYLLVRYTGQWQDLGFCKKIWRGFESLKTKLFRNFAFSENPKSCHCPVYLTNGFESTWSMKCIQLGVSWIVMASAAELTFNLVETPMRERGKHVARRFLTRQPSRS